MNQNLSTTTKAGEAMQVTVFIDTAIAGRDNQPHTVKAMLSGGFNGIFIHNPALTILAICTCRLATRSVGNLKGKCLRGL